MRFTTALQVLSLGFYFQLSAQSEVNVIQVGSQEVLDPSQALSANAILDMGTICWPQGFGGADESDTLYNVIQLAHNPDPKAVYISKAKSCSIKACRNRAALTVCNDNDYAISISANSLGYLAWRIIHRNECTNLERRVCGQQFSKGGWNVILREVSQEECDSGILDKHPLESHNAPQ